MTFMLFAIFNRAIVLKTNFLPALLLFTLYATCAHSALSPSVV